MTTRRNQLKARIEGHQAEIERLSAEAEKIDAIPDFSTAPAGTVLAIATTFRGGPKPFVYMAFKPSRNRWYVTGEAGYKSDEELEEFLTSRTRQVVAVEPLAQIVTGLDSIDLGGLLGAFVAGRD